MLLRKYLPALLGGSAALALAAGTLLPTQAPPSAGAVKAAFAAASASVSASVSASAQRATSLLHDAVPPAQEEERAEGVAFLTNEFGRRAVGKAAVARASRKEEKTAYAHAFFHIVPDDATFAKILETGRFRKVDGAFTGEKRELELWTVNLMGQDIDAVRKRLTEAFPDLFFNLEPYTLEDKVTRKLRGLESLERGERDERSGLVNAKVYFFDDVPEETRAEILKTHFGANDGDNRVRVSLGQLEEITQIKEIRRITEFDPDSYQPTLAKTRAMIQVDGDLQHMDFDNTPSDTWMADSCCVFGRGVIVGVYDTGIDTVSDDETPDDFMEYDGEVNVLRRRLGGIVPWNYGSGVPDTNYDVHGTHVAGIIGGNGWKSGTGYPLRGIAPKVKFISRDMVGGMEAHINNHSHTFGEGLYEGANRDQDASLHDHSVTRTQVFAASNYGRYGFYSLSPNAKNPIIVGAVTHDTALVAKFASLGPTRDGRIKPDLVAPGGSYHYPDARPENPMAISFDHIYIIQGTDTVVSHTFDGTNDHGWENHGYLAYREVASGKLNFTATLGNVMMRNTSVANYTSSGADTLVIAYQIQHPDIPSRTGGVLGAHFSWGTNLDFNADSLYLELPVSGTGTYHVFKKPLASLRNRSSALRHGTPRWPTTPTAMSTLALAIRGDTSAAIQSASVSHPDALPYMQQQGTSMAAPAVTGVGALMLEKWAQVHEVEDLFVNGPWNSTVKAILIHTATDLVKTEPDQAEARPGIDGIGGLNADLCQQSSGVCTNETAAKSFLKYYAGPDAATGYGLVNAKKAVQYTNADSVIQDSIRTNGWKSYKFTVGSGVESLRMTLAWDDLAGSLMTHWSTNKLVNDLELRVESPTGQVFYPWMLQEIPQNYSSTPSYATLDPIDSADIKPAVQAQNSRDNVEVVDVAPGGYLTPGEWKVVVYGKVQAGDRQDFSLVTDFPLTPITHRVGWLHKPFHYDPVSDAHTENGCAEGTRIINTGDEETQNLFSDSLRFTGATGPWYEAYSWPPIHRYYSYGVRINVCPESRDTLPRAKYDYAVLQLSEDCPVNGVSFARVMKDEHAGASTTMGEWSLLPSAYNAGTGTATIRFCYVKGNGTSTTPPPWKQKDRGALHSVTQVPHADCQTMLKHQVVDGNAMNDANSYIWPSTWPSPTTAADSTAIKDNFFGGAGAKANGFTYNTCGVDWE